MQSLHQNHLKFKLIIIIIRRDESFKTINEDNTGNKEKLTLAVKEISRIMIKLAEEVISLYIEYINGLIAEASLVEQIGPALTKIE